MPTEPAALPEWESIPPLIPTALCQRLQMDGIGTNGAVVPIVKITQPIASGQLLAALGKPRRAVPVVHRALPVTLPAGNASACVWKPIDALDPDRQFDQMVVELSAPVANPANPAAGIVARVTLGGTNPSWYWIELQPRAGGWSIGRIFPIGM